MPGSRCRAPAQKWSTGARAPAVVQGQDLNVSTSRQRALVNARSNLRMRELKRLSAPVSRVHIVPSKAHTFGSCVVSLTQRTHAGRTHSAAQGAPAPICAPYFPRRRFGTRVFAHICHPRKALCGSLSCRSFIQPHVTRTLLPPPPCFRACWAQPARLLCSQSES